MIGWINSRLRKQDEGFTLVELMVVVLVIAILIAIAIPTFLGARQRAQDRAAQSDLRNALTAAKVFYVDNEHYNAADTALEAIEPSIDFDDTIGNASQTVVGYLVTESAAGLGDNQVVVLARQSASGTWFCLSDNATSNGFAGTGYGSDAAQANANAWADCQGASW